MTGFSHLELSDSLLQAIEGAGYDAPTPIQEKAIPLILAGKDVLGLAQTGTGKTAAFGLPLLQGLMQSDERASEKIVRSLILAPTRELVNQIAENLKLYGCDSGLRILSVVGGASINRQMAFLSKGADILVATPGRLMDLHEREALRLDQVSVLVLDEADQMLDLGFIHVLRQLSKLLTAPRQTLLFSATMPGPIGKLSRDYQQKPVRIEVAPPGKAADKIRQSVHYIGTQNRVDFLKNCLLEHEGGVSLVFARTKRGAEKLKNVLVSAGFAATSVHGNKSQAQRDKAIADFKSGEANILVATDVAARGIDISGVSHVYNYDLPDVPEVYVHRIGRTARAGAEGEAISFCRPADMHLLAEIEKLLGGEIDIASGTRPTDEDIKKFGAKPVRRGGSSVGRSAKAGRGASRSSGQPNHSSAKRPARTGKGAGRKSSNEGEGSWSPISDVPPVKRKRRKPSSNESEKGRGFVEKGALSKSAGKKSIQEKRAAQRSANRRKASAKRKLRSRS